ncbi:fungal-specific transcription factor domain-containing protein [Fusarium acuminatum]|uniref:Fungal-specific transcription factor domain-containing protein n=1 Tax=Fusarium acuminatum TaxID=5515 RepID=A0ABZ2WNG9_9HYPO
MDNEINVRSTRAQVRRREKINNACISCRNSKARCSGKHPCDRCIRRKETCVFEEKEKKAAVSVNYLDQLHARIELLEAQLQSQSARDKTPDAGSNSVQLEHQEIPSPSRGSSEGPSGLNGRSQSEALTNTLVTSEPQIKVHRYGHAAYLGHSSTLSFSRNVRNLLQQSSPIADPGSVSMERQDISYIRTLPPIALDLSSIPLPKLSYAKYLTNTVIVHIGSLYSIFDSEKFLRRLQSFYDGRENGSVPEANLWHIQMLMVLAFGKSIQSREHSEMGPSGMSYFTSAVEAMPDIRRLYEDPLLSIEILCLSALFMHATDLLQEAYVTIGQALRMSVTKVLNKQFPEALRSPDTEYQRRLWWTVYCIDRKSAAMLGSPSVMRDEDISIPFPAIKPGDESQNAFAIHAILSSHLGKILDVIYGVHDQQCNFLVEVKSILSGIADTYGILREHLPLDIQQQSQPLSRESATLHLLLHQCVILTVRPVLFSLLKPLLTATGPETNTRCSPSPFESMLKMCIESAVQILKIMSMLKQQMMCDIFLPYDIDALFSAAFALILIDIIRPANELLWDLPQVMSLLGEFVSRRVAPAQAYRSDLVQILELHTKIRGDNNDQGPDSRSAFDLGVVPGLAGYAIAHSGQADISPDPLWSFIREGNEAATSTHPDAILSVIDDLNVEGFNSLDTAMLGDGWIWDLDNMSTNI